MQICCEVIRTGILFKAFRNLLDHYNDYTSKLEKITCIKIYCTWNYVVAGFELSISRLRNAIYFFIIAMPKRSHFTIFTIQNFVQNLKKCM